MSLSCTSETIVTEFFKHITPLKQLNIFSCKIIVHYLDVYHLNLQILFVYAWLYSKKKVDEWS